MNQQFATTAGLLAEPSRAVMLLKLLGGRALPAGELAAAADISPQTASEHLSKLTRARLVKVEQQGRHRYYRLGGTEVADVLEAILVLIPSDRKKQPAPPEVGTIAYARTCYSHLAGWLGVRIADSLQAKGFLLPQANKEFSVTEAGRTWFTELGIPMARKNSARQCLDWTERRPHLAGSAGVALYHRFAELGWITPVRKSRVIRVTLQGKEALWRELRIALG